MAVDRKQQMKEITERLEQGVKDIFTSEMYTTYLRTMAKFHNYSFNNTLLIAMQRPDATLVAGFNAWKNKFKPWAWRKIRIRCLVHWIFCSARTDLTPS